MYSMAFVKSIKLRINKGTVSVFCLCFSPPLFVFRLCYSPLFFASVFRLCYSPLFCASVFRLCFSRLFFLSSPLVLTSFVVAKSGPPCLKGVEVWGQPCPHTDPTLLSRFFPLVNTNTLVHIILHSVLSALSHYYL
jgi:hypothetical protein